MDLPEQRARNEFPAAFFSDTTAYRLAPWAGSAAWLLAGAGIWLSNITSSPSNSLFAYYFLSMVGWGIAAVVTSAATWKKPGRILRLAAWGIAILVAVVVGLSWMYRWNIAILALPVATGVAGGIGGIASSFRPGLGRLVSGIGLGIIFLVLAVASFYGTYFGEVLVTWTGQLFGDIPIIPTLIGLAWIIPGGVFGLIAGFALRWILNLHPVASK